MTTENGSSQSQANVHYDVRQDLIQSDANLICDSFNRTVVKWLIDYNFPVGSVGYPKVKRIIDEGSATLEEAQRDKILVDMGFNLSSDFITEKYNVELDKNNPNSTNVSSQPADKRI